MLQGAASVLAELLGGGYIVGKVVYFVGAGLTKSLERPGYRLPLMFDFVRVLADYLHDDVVVSALVNLKLEKVYDWPSPEAAHAAEVLRNEGRKFSPCSREAFKRALKARPSESMEILLKKAGSSSRRLAQRLKSAIIQVFATVGWNVNSAPLERLLEKQIELNRNNHTFIDFNYDLLLERAAEKIHAAGWNVETGYGIPVKSYVPDGVLPSAASDGCASSGPIRVLKPHGSLNWLVPIVLPVKTDVLGYEFEDGPVIVPLTRDGEFRYWVPPGVFNPVSVGDESYPDVEVCVVPPMAAAKHSGPKFLENIREKEKDAIVEAGEIYLIGWSLPETDDDQMRLIQCSMEYRKVPIERLTVVNYGERRQYYDRVARVFGVEKSAMRIFNDGFLDFVDGT